MSAWLRRWYGAGPGHLATLLAGLAVSGYAAAKLVPLDPTAVLTWLVGGALLHDIAVVPLLTLAFAALVSVTRADRGRRPWVNHVRVPALLSLLLLMVFFPLILRLPPRFEAITATSTGVYLERWLGLSVALFALSGGVWLAGIRRRAG